ncbi:hypothetical protein KUTeg_007359 [Tegillarca granosa]|uniref:BTB domain-containing protein n=1 Tax=Tegillarca granosa TaxID=220873 RepID=A0ABQ9FD28_TEGGR|nr:hypothetical protein KUTeg_007359 [Tegillarca granosa]
MISNYVSRWTESDSLNLDTNMDEKKSKSTEQPPVKNPSEEEIRDDYEFVQRFHSLFNSEMFSDIVLKVGENRFHAHKFMLVTASEVFEAMLNEDRWKEANQPEVELSEDDECVFVFPDFLKYIYTGYVTLTTDTVLPILLLSDKYSVKVLHKACVDYMSRHIVETPDANRTLSWYHYAKMTASQELQERCLQFILSNFYIVQHSPDWLEIPRSEMVEFLSSSEIIIDSEYELWKELERWLVYEYNIENVEENLKEVLPLIRFSMIPPKQLLEIESSPLYINHKIIFQSQLGHAYRQHSLLCDDIKSISKSEMYRNYTNFSNYNLCVDMVMSNYNSVPKIDSKRRYDIKVPVQYLPNKVKPNNEHTLAFEIEFWPKGHFITAMLYNTYMQRQNDNTKLKISLVNSSKLNESFQAVKMEITFIIYGMKNKNRYVAYTRTATHIFKANSTKFEFESVIPITKLIEEKSSFLINGKLDAKMFLKIHPFDLKEEDTKRESSPTVIVA